MEGISTIMYIPYVASFFCCLTYGNFSIKILASVNFQIVGKGVEGLIDLPFQFHLVH